MDFKERADDSAEILAENLRNHTKAKLIVQKKKEVAQKRIQVTQQLIAWSVGIFLLTIIVISNHGSLQLRAAILAILVSIAFMIDKFYNTDYED